MDEVLIYELSMYLDNGYYIPEKHSDDWNFFSSAILFDNGKIYKIVFCLQNDKEFLGIIHCYRRNKNYKIR
jgi:hypothetical protein